VAAARGDAVAALAVEAASALPAALRDPLGLPDAAVTRQLWEGMAEQLWAA
jgi:hypothetical protein